MLETYADELCYFYLSAELFRMFERKYWGINVFQEVIISVLSTEIIEQMVIFKQHTFLALIYLCKL